MWGYGLGVAEGELLHECAVHQQDPVAAPAEVVEVPVVQGVERVLLVEPAQCLHGGYPQYGPGVEGGDEALAPARREDRMGDEVGPHDGVVSCRRGDLPPGHDGGDCGVAPLGVGDEAGGLPEVFRGELGVLVHEEDPSASLLPGDGESGVVGLGEHVVALPGHDPAGAALLWDLRRVVVGHDLVRHGDASPVPGERSEGPALLQPGLVYDDEYECSVHVW